MTKKDDFEVDVVVDTVAHGSVPHHIGDGDQGGRLKKNMSMLAIIGFGLEGKLDARHH
jgi:hypothetical protein